MADRSVHYESAFEEYLRQRGIPYVAVDEAKKALFSNAKLKSFDFVVYSKTGPNLLIDVKGRSCRNATGKRGFETWTTERDVQDLMQWEQVFGEGFKAVFTFIYWIDAPMEGFEPEPGMFQHRDKWYLLMGVALDEYRNHMRRRSAKWETVSLPAEAFRNLAKPFEAWL
jgi:DNA-binding sugar fermentation-stimulating protein